MKYHTGEVKYNKLFDPFLADREVDDIHEIGFSTYIVDEKELQIVKKSFDIIFTNEIEESTVFKNFNSHQMQIASVGFPSELVNFIKGFKSINDRNKYIDQFRLNALLQIFDKEKGEYGLRDFFQLNNDVLHLKDFFLKHKARIIDFLYIQSMHFILGLVEKIGDSFLIDDIDYFIDNIGSIVGMTRHVEVNTFTAYEYSSSDKEFIENLFHKYFMSSDDGMVEGKLLEFIRFIQDVTGRSIPKSQSEFLRIFSLNDDDFEKYMFDGKIDNSEYFLEIEKNSLYKSISGYDMNPLFLIYEKYDFKIIIEYVAMTNYKAHYRWNKEVIVLKNIPLEIYEHNVQSNYQKGYMYEKHVIKILENNYGYILEEHTGSSGDGGVDLMMKDSQGKRVAIQCKFSSQKSIGSRVVGEIHKGKDLKKADYGMICSNKAFSSRCQDEAFELGIKLERIGFD